MVLDYLQKRIKIMSNTVHVRFFSSEKYDSVIVGVHRQGEGKNQKKREWAVTDATVRFKKKSEKKKNEKQSHVFRKNILPSREQLYTTDVSLNSHTSLLSAHAIITTMIVWAIISQNGISWHLDRYMYLHALT